MLLPVLLLLFGQAPPVLVQPRDALHLVVESRFTYMASTRPTTYERWIAENMTYEKSGNWIIIIRGDRAVRWVIDTQKRTYSETPVAPQREPAKPGTATEDIHSAGFDYEPEFAWTVTKTAETATMHGRNCGKTSAEGIADFAGIRMDLWLCRSKEPSLESKANAPLIDMARLRYENPATFLRDFLSRQPDMVLMSLEATVDPPIAPRMIHQVRVLTFEKAPAPPGIFDLPSGLQKMIP